MNWEMEMVAFRATALHNLGRDAGNLWVDLLAAARGRGTGGYGHYFSSMAFAGLGQKDSLLASVTRFVDFYRSHQELSPRMIFGGARILAMEGLYEEALGDLEELSALPYREHYSHKTVLGLFYFDALRDDPRFQELVENW